MRLTPFTGSGIPDSARSCPGSFLHWPLCPLAVTTPTLSIPQPSLQGSLLFPLPLLSSSVGPPSCDGSSICIANQSSPSWDRSYIDRVDTSKKTPEQRPRRLHTPRLSRWRPCVTGSMLGGRFLVVGVTPGRRQPRLTLPDSPPPPLLSAPPPSCQSAVPGPGKPSTTVRNWPDNLRLSGAVRSCRRLSGVVECGVVVRK